jgi:hypothetical protein
MLTAGSDAAGGWIVVRRLCEGLLSRFGERGSFVSSVVVIVASVLCAVAVSATLAVALGRAAARGDEELARELLRDRPVAAASVGRHHSYAGLGSSPARSAREPLLLYETFSVPSIPAWRWPGTEQ